MKIMVSLAGSDVLYHILGIRYALLALTEDKFRLQPTLGNGMESRFSSKKSYFLSMARSKNSYYIQTNSHNGQVMFVLDGRSMGHRYEIKAVDYWNNSAYHKPDEMEDRLFALSPEIPCRRYIREIHLCGDHDLETKLYTIAKKLGIPMYKHADAKAFRTLDVRNAVSIDKGNRPEVRKIGERAMRAGKHYSPPDVTFLEALWDAIAIKFNGTESEHDQYVMGAKSESHRKRRQDVYDRLVSTIRYGNAEPSTVETFNQELAYGRYDDANTKYRARIDRFMRARQFDTKQLIEFLAEKFSAFQKAETKRKTDAAKEKFPHKPTFYIYRDGDGYRLEAENYPELNMRSDDIGDITSVVYKFHRDSAGIWKNYSDRIVEMF